MTFAKFSLRSLALVFAIASFFSEFAKADSTMEAAGAPIPSYQNIGNKTPYDLQDVGIDEHLGSSLNTQLTFKDETGASVPLKKYFDGTKPVLFFLVYYGCPNLCTLVLNAAVDSIKPLSLKPGKNFEVVAVSIDPKEGPEFAAEKKQAYVSAYNGAPAVPISPTAGTISKSGDTSSPLTSNTSAGWHFLTGKQPEITELAKELGFKYKWDQRQNQFAHASVMYVLTGDGKISRMFYGIDYPPRDVKVALLEAGQGKIGTLVDKILLFCYHYDSSTKKYVLMANRMMSAGGALTLLIMGIIFVRLIRRERNVHA